MPELRARFVEKLFSEHRYALQAFFSRRLRTKQDAADLVQEVYLRMLRVRDSDAIRNPEGYLFTVATHVVYEHSLAARRAPGSVDAEPVEAAAMPDPSHGFEELFDLQARVARLQQVLAQLPPKCRATVHLRYQHGLSYQEIGTALGISAHMVQKYLGIALAHCRRRMVSLR
jgi:RNA polymerase sigma-70 factor (ECF subfamily)